LNTEEQWKTTEKKEQQSRIEDIALDFVFPEVGNEEQTPGHYKHVTARRKEGHRKLAATARVLLRTIEQSQTMDHNA